MGWKKSTGTSFGRLRQLTRVPSPVSCLMGFLPVMFNLYQSLSRKEDIDEEPQTTGHDRFCTHQHDLQRSFRRRKRGTGRRAHSFSGINTRSPATVKLGLRRQRSALTEEENDLDLSKARTVSVSGGRTLLPVHRFDSLAKLFSCFTLSQSGTCSSHLRRIQRWVNPNIQVTNNHICRSQCLRSLRRGSVETVV